MTTKRQILANRQNSRGSTGPKTRKGKAKSKMNAMKHGLLAADLIVRDEDPAEFAQVLENLVEELQPQGPLEAQLVERVATCMWRLRRIYRVEVGIFTHESLTIELSRAKEEAKSFEEDDGDRLLASMNSIRITDKERHSQATAKGREGSPSTPGKVFGPRYRFQTGRG